MYPGRRQLATRLMPLDLIRCKAARLVALALYILASASLGFAHKPAPVSVDLAQFILPDGTLPPICGGKGSQDTGDHHAHLPSCDACCLTHASGLPPPFEAESAALTSTPCESIAPRARPRVSLQTIAAHGPRGPPLG